MPRTEMTRQKARIWTASPPASASDPSHAAHAQPATRHSEGLWTQAEAAEYLCVSQRYLRASSCPKILLPGTGMRGKPLVRYSPADVRGWAEQRRATKRFGP
jgi:hypothetical protein